MLSASKALVKNNQVRPGQQVPIITKQPPAHSADDSSVELLSTAELSQLAVAKQKQEQAIDQTRSKILAEAKAQALAIKQQAQQEGQQAGYQLGLAQGKVAGQQQAAALIEQAKLNLQQAITTANQFQSEQQSRIEAWGIAIAEKILHQQLDLHPEEVQALIQPILLKIAQPQELVIVKAHSRYHDVLTTYLTRQQQELPQLHFLVMDDDQLGAQKLILESDEALVTCDVHEELEKLKHALSEVDS